MDPLLLESAVRLAARIRAREVSSREVLEAHIARAEAVNPVINAVVDRRYDAARAEADRADDEVRAARGAALPPFHGVPITIKECMGVTGLHKTAGLVARKDHVAVEDAVAVQRLRAAGAIPFAVTNVSELMMWYETYNHVYGRTNNPYDPARTVGGSSGGEGAIVGAGGSPMGLGADIGGSIRMPAFFNGVFGHKPTGGLVPCTGHWPMPENGALRFNTTGPLCRRAEDLWPFLRAIAGPDAGDAGSYAMALGDPARVELSELTVYDVESNGSIAVSDDLRAAQRDVAAHLSTLGARVEPLAIRALKVSFEIWSAMMDEAADTPFALLLGNGERKVRPGLEFLRWLGGRRVHTIPSLGLALFEKLPALLGKRGERAIAIGRALKAELEEKLGRHAVILYPSFPAPAPKHHRPLARPFNFQYTGIWNVLEFPSTAVPLGLNQAGLPLGVQVVAAPGNDHLTIAVALELERRFGGWVPPEALAQA